MKKRNLHTNIPLLFLILIFSAQIVLALDTPVVTVVNDSTNQYGQYTISSQLRAGPRIELIANQDTLNLTFGPETVLPASVDPSHITVNGVASSGTFISGQRLGVQTPVVLKNFQGGERSFTIVISSSAKIRNPSTPGSDYTIYVSADAQSTSDAATSDPYSIYQCTSTITSASAVPNPALANQNAAYVISFTTGSGGYLTATSGSITIDFDPNAAENPITVPSGSLTGVTVNNNSVSAVAEDNIVTITVQEDVDNEAPVTINFPMGAGIRNPAVAGDYTVSIKTSSENTYVETEPFSIASLTEFSITSVTLADNMVNTISEYAIAFRTSSTGGLTAEVDEIAVILAQNTYLPATLTAADVMITSGGFSDNAFSATLSKDNSADPDTVIIVPSFDIISAAAATITLTNSAGVRNPSEDGNYTVQMYTTQDNTPVASNPYQISGANTTISQPTVTPGSSTPGAVTTYAVSFDLGGKGRLHPGVSTIKLFFNSGYTLSTTSTHYDNSTITVNEGTPVAVSPSLIAVDNTAKTITITVPSSVITENGNAIEILLEGTTTDPITNPSTAGQYTLGVNTSVEPTQITSYTYAIGGTAVTNVSVALTNPGANGISGYTCDMTITTRLRYDREDYIKIVFPVGTILPATIPTAYVTLVNGEAAYVSVVPSTRTLLVGIPSRFSENQETVVIDAAAGIVNPAVPSASYTATVSTSQDIVPVSSAVYSITGNNTQVSDVTATSSPHFKNMSNVIYNVSFTTSSVGKLAGGTPYGSSTITIDFDDVTDVPETIPAAYIKVNSIACQNATVVSSGSGGVVQLSVPSGTTIESSSAVTVTFEAAAGLDNNDDFPPGENTFEINVLTSSDAVYAAGEYTIYDPQPLYVQSVTVLPTTQNAAAGYTIKFLTGAEGGTLEIGEYIYIDFPQNTRLPSVISAGDVRVNNVQPSANPVVSGQRLSIPVPIEIGIVTDVTVLINQTANVLNPTLVQSYTLQVSTDADPDPITSPTYNITQTSTRTSVSDVTVTTATPGTASPYSISFTTGANGRLLAGTSTITVTFGAATGVNATPSNYDAVYITVDGSPTLVPVDHVSVSGQAVTVRVPSGVSVDNNDPVTLLIDGTTPPIINPSTSGSYTLTVRTSVEVSNVTSNPYTISDVQPVTNVTNTLGDDEVNAPSGYTVGFQTGTGGGLTAQSGTISVIFPVNTYLPSSMATSNVQVNGTNAHAVAVNTFTRTVTVTVPAAINENTTVAVTFLQAAGLQNPSIYGNYTLKVKTSSQPLEATSGAYTLQPATTIITDLAVLVTPQVVSQPGRFEFGFRTGARGRLLSGTSTISLVFPHDIYFSQGTPQTSKVTVNSTTPGALILNEGTGTDPDVLVITVPSSVTIGNTTWVTVVIDATAGVITPSTYASLTYQAYTSVESGVVSKDYSLPVELSLFESREENGYVFLHWVTESEIHNAHWLIHRQDVDPELYESITSGKSGVEALGSDWQVVATIKGQGSSSQRTDYAFADSLTRADHIYAYRLADVSYSGQVTYHDVVFQKVTVPMVFTLGQNYPNPFNPVTNIRYQLPELSRVKLIVYNILGQEIITLVDGSIEPGYHKISWNGYNNHGDPASSGIYIYRIQITPSSGKKPFTQVRKMVLIR